MTVSRICRREVDLVDLDESAWGAAERMRQRAVRSLVVLDRERRPIGIVTAHDLVVKVMATERLPRTTRVRDIMTFPVKTIRDSSTVPLALAILRRSSVHPLPVVDGGGKLVGILTRDMVLSHMAGELDSGRESLGTQTSDRLASPADE